MKWVTFARLNALSAPVGNVFVAPVPNGWTTAQVQTWLQNDLANYFGWRIQWIHSTANPSSPSFTVLGSGQYTAPGVKYPFEWLTDASNNNGWNSNSGNVGIGTTVPGQKLDVVGGYIRSNTGFCINASCITAWPGGGGLTGAGTTNYISKWTGATSLGNSQVYDNGANVGIGTAGPAEKLDVLGGVHTSGWIKGGNLGVVNSALALWSVSSEGGFGIGANDGRAVGIGRTTANDIGIGVSQGSSPLAAFYSAGPTGDGVIKTWGARNINFIIERGAIGGGTGIMSLQNNDPAATNGTIHVVGAGMIVNNTACGGCWAQTSNIGDLVIRTYSGSAQLILTLGGGAYVKLGPGGVYSNVTKFFEIPHPLDPANTLLRHATLEGPEAGVYYRGEGQLQNGRAEVLLPTYFEALTRKEGRTVLLTNIDGGDVLWVETQDGAQVKDGKFMVRSSSGNSSQKFNWEVKAVRSDVPPVEVEVPRESK